MNLLSTPRRISIALGFSRFLKMLLGLVVLYLSIKYFGTTFERDSWVLSIGLWGLMICFLYSPINDTFRTKFIFLRDQNGEESAMKSVNSLMNLFNLSYLLVAFLIFIFSDGIISLLAPGFDDGMRDFLSIMIFSLIPFFIFQQHGNILIALLNTYDSYFYPEVIILSSSVINILSIIFLSDMLGIYSLVVATTLNGLLMVIFLTCMLKHKVASFSLISREGLRGAAPFVKFSLPMYMNAFCGQIYLFVEKSLCTHFGEGAVSVFDYVRQVASLPYVVFSTIIPIIVTPLLSTAFVKGNEDTFSSELRRFSRLFLYFTGFVCVSMCLTAEQISYLLFSYKQEVFIGILGYLCLAIFCATITMLCGQALIARGKVGDYVLAFIAGNLVSIALSFLWVDALGKLEYLALFYFIGQFVSSLIILYKLKIKEKMLMIKEYCSVVVSCGLIMSLMMFFRYQLRGSMLLSEGKIYAVTYMMICVVMVFFLFLCLILLFCPEERSMLRSLMKRFSKHK